MNNGQHKHSINLNANGARK